MKQFFCIYASGVFYIGISEKKTRKSQVTGILFSEDLAEIIIDPIYITIISGMICITWK